MPTVVVFAQGELRKTAAFAFLKSTGTKKQYELLRIMYPCNIIVIYIYFIYTHIHVFYICVYTHTHIYIFVYVYSRIYIERQQMLTPLSLCVMYLNVYLGFW